MADQQQELPAEAMPAAEDAAVKESDEASETPQADDSAPPAAEAQEPEAAAPEVVESTEADAEPAAEPSEPVESVQGGAEDAELAAEEVPADDAAEAIQDNTEKAAASEEAEPAAEAAGAADAEQEDAESSEPAAEQGVEPMEVDGAQEEQVGAAPEEQSKTNQELMKDLFDESSDDEDAEKPPDKRKALMEDLFGGESDSEEETDGEEDTAAAAPVKKRKLTKKADKNTSDDEDDSPKKKKARSADDDDAPVDNFIDDEGVPDHLRFDDETGPTHFQGESDDDQDAGSDRDDGPDPADDGPDELDQVMGTKKVKRKKTSDESKRQAAERFIDKLHEAADADEQAMAQEEPAVAKLTLLEDLQTNLLKKDLQEFFLDHNCLLALKRYLELLPGTKERPNLTIRSAVLKLVTQLPIGIFHLEKSRGNGETTIAEEIHRMARDKQETKENKHTARRLVENWYRLAVGSSTNQKDLARVDMERFQDEPAERRQQPEDPEQSGKTGIQMHRLAVKVPRKASYDYRIRPESSEEVRLKAAEKVSNKKDLTQKGKMKTKMLLRAKNSKIGQVRAETLRLHDNRA